MSSPSGTVTFLFTDIEGSTKLWEAHPQAMRPALARHDALLRQAIEANSGVVFKTIGDAFCAAFATAPDALNAAFAAQLALAAEAWPDALALRVRMALHTGTPELRDGDYFGQPLNRVARLLAAGHGGQTLLSDVAHDLTRDSLPDAVSLLALGEHRLKDLSRPEPVFQLLHPDLPSEFRPLKSLDNPELLNNLPQQTTSFVGREKEIETVKSLLARTRLLTLTGSGGCGKTRLGLQVAADVLENYPDGAWFVELAPLADPTLVPQTLAQVLNVSEETGKSLVQTLTTTLKDRKMLLVLDNCEHVLDACARLADTLLRGCPHLKILASSREGLGIAGEQTYRLPSLSLPDAKQPQTVKSVNQYEAVRLFIERALAVQPQFAVTNQNAPALAQVCVRLDGIPLAIELAAARVRSLALEEINNKLDNRFRLLTGGSRTALPRQQTLRALIDWSYDLLSAQEKTLLCRLSVFAGGWALDAAEQVGAGEKESSEKENSESIEDWEVLDLLTSLADKSLAAAESAGESTRYRLLETVRQYAQDRLAESGEGERVRERHQAFFLTFAQSANALLLGPEQATGLARMEREHDNLRAALAGGSQETALQIAGAMYYFWYIRGYYTEGRKRLTDTLASPAAQARTLVRAKALHAVGGLARVQDDYPSARSLAEESLALFKELGYKQGVAGALGNLSIIAREQGDFEAARSITEESLSVYRELENKMGIANSLMTLGNIANDQGDYVAARTLHEESLALHRELGYTLGIANALGNVGLAASKQGDYAAARALQEEGLALHRELGNKHGIVHSLSILGEIASSRGDYAVAQSLEEQCLTLYLELGERKGIAVSLHHLGGVASMQKQPERAARLWGAAEALREAISAPLLPSERDDYNQQVAQARSAMDEDAFAAGWAKGRAMTTEQAVEYALKEVELEEVELEKVENE